MTFPGAFEEGAPVRVSAYGHTSWDGKLPVGRGAIKTTNEEAIAALRFFLRTEAGRETFEVVKEMSEEPGLQEWSYGFDIIDGEPGTFQGQDVRFLRKLKVHEVSPVLLGAGVDTRTLSVKATRNAEDPEGRLAARAEQLAAAVRSFEAHAVAHAHLRSKEGKGIAPDNRLRVMKVAWELEDVVKALRSQVGIVDGDLDRLLAQHEADMLDWTMKRHGDLMS